MPTDPPAPAAPPEAIRDEWPEALVLGDFRILAKVGGGTQGAVYRAHQLSRNRTVALKVLAGGAAYRPAAVARFARESALLARLDHPGVVRCHGAGAERGFHYFATEFVDGPSAAALLRRANGPLSPAVAVRLARRCAEALGHAAARGITHRDVKPGNVLVGPDGAIKLTDWGLARPADAGHTLTAPHTVLGTVRYAAPEQFRDARRADRRSDVYALGGTLYELLTGRVPFPGDDWLAILRAKEAGAFPPAGAVNPGVPSGWDRVLTRMLAPDPADRYPDFDHLIRALDAVGLADERPDPAACAGAGPAVVPTAAPGPRLRVLVVFDESEYVPLAQHALLAAGVPHDLTTVEDGHRAPGAVARDRRTGWGLEPDALLLGLTSPTHASLRVLDEVRGGAARRGPPVFWLSRSPDGAALLRGLGLDVGVWVTGFGDLEPLSAALKAAHTDLAGGPPTPP